jgi:hypothetical protein
MKSIAAKWYPSLTLPRSTTSTLTRQTCRLLNASAMVGEKGIELMNDSGKYIEGIPVRFVHQLFLLLRRHHFFLSLFSQCLILELW